MGAGFSAIHHFAIRIEHLHARLITLVYADPNRGVILHVRDHKLRVLIFVGQRNKLDTLTRLDRAGVRTAIENVETSTPPRGSLDFRAKSAGTFSR